MPVQACSADGKQGFKWGDAGVCYTHDGSPEGIAAAKQKAVKQGLAIGGGKLSYADTYDVPKVREGWKAPTLETVDLERLDIMTAGERVWGRGSPPEGDLYDEAALRKIADDSNKVVELTKPPNKIGHDFNQRLASTVGLTPGEMPALGWLQKFYVDTDDKGRVKLYTDLKGVPKKFASLAKAGVFRTRSPEVSSFRTEYDGQQQSYDRVIRGLAWHGAQPSAFKTLDDIYSLFEDADEAAVLYEHVFQDDAAEATVVEWVERNPELAVETAARIFADRITVEAPAADTYRVSELKIDAEQSKKLRDTLGLDESADLDKVFEAVDALKKKDDGADDDKDGRSKDDKGGKGDEGKDGAGKTYTEDDLVTHPLVVELKAKAERGDKAFEERRVETRDRFFEEAVEAGKIEPAQVEGLKKAYDETPDLIRHSVDAMPENPEWKRVYGVDGDGVGDGTGEDEVWKAYAAATGLEGEAGE